MCEKQRGNATQSANSEKSNKKHDMCGEREKKSRRNQSPENRWMAFAQHFNSEIQTNGIICFSYGGEVIWYSFWKLRIQHDDWKRSFLFTFLEFEYWEKLRPHLAIKAEDVFAENASNYVHCSCIRFVCIKKDEADERHKKRNKWQNHTRQRTPFRRRNCLTDRRAQIILAERK